MCFVNESKGINIFSNIIADRWQHCGTLFPTSPNFLILGSKTKTARLTAQLSFDWPVSLHLSESLYFQTLCCFLFSSIATYDPSENSHFNSSSLELWQVRVVFFPSTDRADRFVNLCAAVFLPFVTRTHFPAKQIPSRNYFWEPLFYGDLQKREHNISGFLETFLRWGNHVELAGRLDSQLDRIQSQMFIRETASR